MQKPVSRLSKSSSEKKKKKQFKSGINLGSEKREQAVAMADPMEAESYSDQKERKGEIGESTL